MRKLRDAGVRVSNARLDVDLLEGQDPNDLLPLFGEIINQGDFSRLSVYSTRPPRRQLQEAELEEIREAISRGDLHKAIPLSLPDLGEGKSLVSRYLHNFAGNAALSSSYDSYTLWDIFTVPCPMLQPNILPSLTQGNLPALKKNLEEKRKGSEKIAVVINSSLTSYYVPAQDFQGIVVNVRYPFYTGNRLAGDIGKVDLISIDSPHKRQYTGWTPALKKGGAIRFSPSEGSFSIIFPRLPDTFAPLGAPRVDRQEFLEGHLAHTLTLEDVRRIVGDFKLCLFLEDRPGSPGSPERILGDALLKRLVPTQLKQLLEEHLWKEFPGLRPQVDFIGNPEHRKVVINLVRQDERVLFREVAKSEGLTSTVILKKASQDETERPVRAGDVLEVKGEKRVIIGVDPLEADTQVTFEGTPLEFNPEEDVVVTIYEKGKYFFPHPALFTEGEWKRGWHVSENRFFVPHGDEAQEMFKVGSTVVIPGVGPREITSYNISVSAEGTPEFAHVGYAGAHIEGDSIPLAPFMLDHESLFVNRSPVLWGKGQAEESWKEGIDRKNRLFYVLNTKGNRDAWKVGTDHEVDLLGRVRVLEQIDAGDTLHLKYEPIELE